MDEEREEGRECRERENGRELKLAKGGGKKEMVGEMKIEERKR